jgi:serine/threonine protein phosphatase PrpC
VRQINQDAFLELPELGVWAVADGVGGHQRGETASKAVIDAISEIAAEKRPENIVESVRRKLLGVNRALVEAAQRLGPDTVIGSTVAALVADGSRCVCLWAGDSRIYGIRGGRLTRLTRDHSQVEELVEQGKLSADEALHHPEANIIYRAVGKSEPLDLDANVYDIYRRDKFMLCTDGLTKELSDREICEILSKGDCHDSCRALTELALARECRDNIAVVVIDVNVDDRQDDGGTVQVSTLPPSRSAGG